MEMTNHGVWQLGYCTEQKCKVFYDFASKVEKQKSFGISTNSS